MSDIFDYIRWRGDLTFLQDDLNCVDCLIFSQMAYFPLDGLWKEEEDEAVNIQEAFRRVKKKEKQGEQIFWHMEKDPALFEAMASSKRFGSLLLRDFENRIEPEAEKQFAAVTVLIPGAACVVYRGTDNTLVGWKEDFNMSFSTPVPSQTDAAKYIRRIAALEPGPLIVCGHSKGGNLAVYASLFCEEEIRRRILAVYNNDGPGFDGRVVPKDTFRLLEGRLHTFVPQSSVIGMLMEHEENYTVVHSVQTGIFQHELYSWEVLGPDFVRLESVTEGSRFLDQTIKEWLLRMDSSQRETFVDTLFSVLGASGASTFTELKEDILKNFGAILKAMVKVDPKTRSAILGILSQLVDSAQDTIPGFLREQAGHHRRIGRTRFTGQGKDEEN